MAAFNYILCEIKCPGCHQPVEVQFQTHMASEEGEEGYEFWMTYGKPAEGLLPSEFCPGTCPGCGAELYARRTRARKCFWLISQN